MKLRELLGYSDVTIQCHDNPDADSIGSGYALYVFFREKGKNTKLVYSGSSKLSKPNLTILVKELNIPLVYEENIKASGLLITVDCQYGAGNVSKAEADHVAIIDHHKQEIFDIPLTEIRDYLGSCSTLVWQMLEEEGFDVSGRRDVATALYYGLMCDTNNFAETKHPADRDMQEALLYDPILIRRLRNSNLTMTDLEIAGIALLRNSYNEAYRYTVIKTQPCDPNILGFISDLAIQVDSIDVCVVYNESQSGIKYSVRSCVREVMASELAEYISGELGSGGGHEDKAGGFISRTEFNRQYPGINTDEYLMSQLTKYFGSFRVIDYESFEPDMSSMERYREKLLINGYIKSTDVFGKGTPVIVRSLKCDMDDLVSDDDLYFIIDCTGEVSPITREKFERGYEAFDEPFELETQYFPHIRNKATGQNVNLRPYSRKCLLKNESYVYAKQLTETVKLFTKWDRDTYMHGKPGDYLIISEDDPSDIFVITKDMFDILYEK